MFDLPITFGETVLSLTTDAATGDLVVRTKGTKGEQERRARAVVFAVGYYDHPNRLNIPGEDLPHVSHYYNEAHSCVPAARGDRGRQELGGRNGARAASLRREGHDGPSSGDAGRVDQVLGEARHREPDRRGLDRRALREQGPRDHAGRRRDRAPGPERVASGRPRVPHDRLSRRLRSAEGVRARDRSGDRTSRCTTRPRSSLHPCRTSSLRAACWQGRTPRRSSSRTGGFTGRGLSRCWRSDERRTGEGSS